jgi:CRISPR-associated endonuclease Cas2
MKRLKMWAPRKGAVRVLLITNKQFADAKILTGQKKYQEKIINEKQLLLF